MIDPTPAPRSRFAAWRQLAPELRSWRLLLGRPIDSRERLGQLRQLDLVAQPVHDKVEVREEIATGTGAEPVPMRVYLPAVPSRRAGALLWLHGGGLVAGSERTDAAHVSRLVADLDIVVATVGYRLAPEHPFPAGLDDCLAAWDWLLCHARELGFDPDRVVVGGASAGGGLAASLCQRIRDREGQQPAFQLLRYPMLDDRTAVARPRGAAPLVWTPTSNHFAWSAYLGRAPREEDAPVYAAARRMSDLSGLPPAWLGVGGADLFHEETVRYAAALEAAGVPVQLHVQPGMYHGADGMAPDAAPVREFLSREVGALRHALER